MKRYLLAVLVFSIYLPVSRAQQNVSPNASMNYVRATTYRISGVKTAADAAVDRNVADENHVIQYYDGFGRPVQTVTVKGNADGTKT